MSRSNRDDKIVRASKYLSFLLRHGAEKVGLVLRSDGFASLTDVLALPESRRHHLTESLVRQIVDSNDKQRFTLGQEDDQWLIRANQGHSANVGVTSLEMTPLTSITQLPNGVAIHGTYYRHWNAIKAQGLSRMSRAHVHFALGEPGESDVISGMRSSAEVLIYLNIPKALQEGLPLFLSSNGVLLSPGLDQSGIIPPSLFAYALDVKSRKHLLLT